ncbi:hypothetical protein ACR784_10210 [Sphingobacterium multivorum]
MLASARASPFSLMIRPLIFPCCWVALLPMLADSGTGIAATLFAETITDWSFSKKLSGWFLKISANTRLMSVLPISIVTGLAMRSRLPSTRNPYPVCVLIFLNTLARELFFSERLMFCPIAPKLICSMP